MPGHERQYRRPELVIIGQICRDILIIDGRRQPVAAGGSVYYAAFAASAAASAGVRLLCLPKLALADYALLGELWARGLAILPIYAQQTTTMEESFEGISGYVRRSRVLSVAPPFSAAEVPVPEAEVFYLAGLLYGEFPEPLIEELATRGRLALDAQAVLRRPEGELVAQRDWPNKERCLPLVHFLKADLEEARVLTGRDTAEGALERLHRWGVKEAMITEDRRVTVSQEGRSFTASLPAYTPEARSGRGDTCFGAYLSSRLNHDARAALKHAARITARKLRRPGPYLE